MLWVSAYTASSCCEGVNNEDGKGVRRHVEAASGELLRVIGSRVWLVVRAHGLPVEAGSLSWGVQGRGEVTTSNDYSFHFLLFAIRLHSQPAYFLPTAHPHS